MSAPATAKCLLRPLSLPSFSFSPCPHVHLSWLPGEILGSRVKIEWGLGPPLPAAKGTPRSRLLFVSRPGGRGPGWSWQWEEVAGTQSHREVGRG